MKSFKRNQWVKEILTLITIFSSILSYTQPHGIEWQKNYGGTSTENFRSIQQTHDGGFIIGGYSNSDDIDVSNNHGGEDFWVVKVNSIGNVEWEKNYGGSGDDKLVSLKQTSDGGYILGGQTNSNNQDVSNHYGFQDYWVVKIDSIGNIEWEKNYGGSSRDDLRDIIETNGGGYLLGGETKSNDVDVSNNNGDEDGWVVKIDSIGNIEWEKNYGDLGIDRVMSLQQTNDGGFILGGISDAMGDSDFWLVKINSLGTVEWEKYYTGPSNDVLYSLQQTIDDGFILGGFKSISSGISYQQDYWVVKVDSIGNVEWEKNYGYTSGQEILYSIQQTIDGGFIFGGESSSFTYGNVDYWITKLDPIGNVEWEKNYGGTGFDILRSVESTNDGGFILGGTTFSSNGDVSTNNGILDYWIVKLKPFLGQISGNVILDYNENCINDANDSIFTNSTIQANPLSFSNSVYSSTNNLGWYNMYTDTIPYAVSIISFSPYYDTVVCSQKTQLANLSSSNLRDTIDFFIKPTVLCPYLEVDIAAPLLRRCFSSNYTISYCNNGSIIADSAYIEVEFDPLLVIDTSSIPWSTINGYIYTFQVGDLDIFECGSFTVTVSVPCDSTTALGQVLCSEAHIYPDSLCLPIGSTWNGAELKASAACIGTDTIEFTLKNIGTGNMGGDVPVIVIEDVFLIMDTLSGLNIGEEMKWKFPFNNSTQRMIAQQPADHPFKTFTTDFGGGCGSIIAPPGPPGPPDTTIIGYPNDEEAPYVAIDCQPIIGAYDPNDKTAYPTGVSANHYISKTTDLEYKIRFQNTGTDTAFTVVITDSISSLLDITTFNAGASSHSYTYNIYGTGVVDFTFSNILLPDSFVNEPASHGFVQYKIKQKASNQAGDIIYNNADIFFDYNLPVRTNTTFNEIGGIVLDTLIYKFPVEEIPDGINELSRFNIDVYPNPANNFITFKLDESLDNVSIELYNLEGKMQQKAVGVHASKLTIQRGNLANGIYLFKIYAEDKEIAYGKLIFK